jgi:hypothetical protein
MWCLTPEESQSWCEGHGVHLDSRNHPILDDLKYDVQVPLSDRSWSRLFYVSQFIASSVEPFEKCLFWVTLSGVWGSSENWHLFYRFRDSYHERRPLDQAPGHVFLRHEAADLTTFIQLALISGWDFYVVPRPLHQAAVFVTHDEFVHFYTSNDAFASKARTFLD